METHCWYLNLLKAEQLQENNKLSHNSKDKNLNSLVSLRPTLKAEKDQGQEAYARNSKQNTKSQLRKSSNLNSLVPDLHKKTELKWPISILSVKISLSAPRITTTKSLKAQLAKSLLLLGIKILST